MVLIFEASQANEHELGVYLGQFFNSSDRLGTFELYFSDQDEYLTLIDNKLYLNSNWQFDFETKKIFLLAEDGGVSFYDFSDMQVPIKFVDLYGNFDWINADLKFMNIDEGPLTFRGWQSPWSPLQVVEKSGLPSIDALLPDIPVKWNSDTFYDQDFSQNGSTVITFSFPGTSSLQTKFADNYDTWKTPEIAILPFNEPQMDAVRLALKEWSNVANITFVEVVEEFLSPISRLGEDDFCCCCCCCRCC